MIPGKPLIFYFVIGLAAFLTGLSKGGLGGSLGVLITPIVVLVMPSNQAVGFTLPILMLGDVFAMAAHWGYWDGKILRALLPGAIVGVTLGTFVLTNISAAVLRDALGVLVLVFFVYRLLEIRLQSRLALWKAKWLGVATGGLAGFTSTLAHAGGPPITIYLLMQKLSPPMFVATSVLFFTVVNWIKVPYYWVAGLFDFQTQLRLAWLLLAVPVGVWAGKWLTQRAPREIFDRIILVLLAITGVWLLLE
jgi:uncharacterized membrane protein YfcA